MAMMAHHATIKFCICCQSKMMTENELVSREATTKMSVLLMLLRGASIRPIARVRARMRDSCEGMARPTTLLMQRDLPLSNADGGSVLECNLVIEDY
jgi:hypothetical protein